MPPIHSSRIAASRDSGAEVERRIDQTAGREAALDAVDRRGGSVETRPRSRRWCGGTGHVRRSSGAPGGASDSAPRSPSSRIDESCGPWRSHRRVNWSPARRNRSLDDLVGGRRRGTDAGSPWERLTTETSDWSTRP